MEAPDHMAKTILIATDLTARGDRPFARAKLLARSWHARCTILFVNAGKSPVDETRVRASLIRNYGNDADGCDLVIENGSVPQTIAETASRLDSDLIIVGAARHNNISDFFLGTAVDHLVHHADPPVLVVKERPRKPYQTIMVATDFSDCSRHALQTAMDLFPEAKIELVHAYHVAYEAWLKSDDTADDMKAAAEREMQKFVVSLNLTDADQSRITSRLAEGNLHQSIYNLLDSGTIDLLVLGTHGRGGLASATIGSRASEMLEWSPVDVLMVGKPR